MLVFFLVFSGVSDVVHVLEAVFNDIQEGVHMRGGRKVKPRSNVPPVALDLALRIHAPGVQALLVPVLILVLEVLVLAGVLRRLLLTLWPPFDFPPDQVVVYFVDELVGDFHADLHLLSLRDSVLERDVDHAHQLGEPQELVLVRILPDVWVVNHVVFDVVANFGELRDIVLLLSRLRDFHEVLLDLLPPFVHQKQRLCLAVRPRDLFQALLGRVVGAPLVRLQTTLLVILLHG